MALVTDPNKIKQMAREFLRDHCLLESYTPEERQILMRLIILTGDMDLTNQIKFSDGAVTAGLAAIKRKANLLYDHESVYASLKQNMLYQKPLCFTGKAQVISRAKSLKQTRAMTAIDYWEKYCNDYIALFGHSATALQRLLDYIDEERFKPPALIIATPAGFVNAPDVKENLISMAEKRELNYIVSQESRGSPLLVGHAINGLIKLYQGEQI